MNDKTVTREDRYVITIHQYSDGTYDEVKREELILYLNRYAHPIFRVLLDSPLYEPGLRFFESLKLCSKDEQRDGETVRMVWPEDEGQQVLVAIMELLFSKISKPHVFTAKLFTWYDERDISNRYLNTVKERVSDEDRNRAKFILYGSHYQQTTNGYH